MKTLFFALLLFVGLVAAAPQAEARSRYARYYDDCARPAYRHTYVRHYPVRSYRYYRPAYHRPVRVHYRSYDYCAPRVHYYSARPRLSFFFGF